MRRFCVSLALAVLITALPSTAQMPTEAPGAPDISRVTGGTYKLDPAHSQILFTVLHLGFSFYRGFFGDLEGTMTLDPKAPQNAKLSIDIPINKVVTTSPKLNEHLMKPEFFDAAKYPTAHFESTKVTVNGTHATINGNLTIKGVTKPVTLDAHFVGAGKGLPTGKETIGFEANGNMKRSDYGVSAGIPLVSDTVPLEISVAFEKTN